MQEEEKANGEGGGGLVSTEEHQFELGEALSLNRGTRMSHIEKMSPRL